MVVHIPVFSVLFVIIVVIVYDAWIWRMTDVACSEALKRYSIAGLLRPFAAFMQVHAEISAAIARGF